MLDFDQPMMIEGMPDTTIVGVRKITGMHTYEGTVRRQGMSTWIEFRVNGWVCSTTYATSRVINTSTHEAAVLKRHDDSMAEMEANSLWAAFG